MPAHAVGIGLGVLATITIGSIIAKNVIDNWDEIQDGYDAFADNMEDAHNVHLPRFRDRRAHGFHHSDRRRRPEHHLPYQSLETMAHRRSSRDWLGSQDGLESRSHDEGYTTAHSTHPLRHATLTSRTSRSHEVDLISGDDHEEVDGFREDDADDAMFQQAIEASLLDTCGASDEVVDYQVPQYPKSDEFANLGSSTREAIEGSEAPVNPFSFEKHGQEQDGDTWSDTWTVTDASPENSVHGDEQLPFEGYCGFARVS